MKENKHNILYIMRSVHMDGGIFVNDKKIGVTGNSHFLNLANRLKVWEYCTQKNE